MECENCGHEIIEEAYRVLCTNKKDFRVKIYYYCSKCGEELISEYRKKGESVIEQ
jgi:DNA-directed RNA polymerase subunit RPC12/RpoP